MVIYLHTNPAHPGELDGKAALAGNARPPGCNVAGPAGLFGAALGHAPGAPPPLEGNRMEGSWRQNLGKLAMDLGIKAGHKNYTKFIVLGRSRTGSNFLRGLLSSHGQIIVFGEIFKNDQSIEWGTDGYPQKGKALKLMQSDPPRFLDQIVFKKFPLEISAVGFKLFYYHAQMDGLKPIWPYLKSRQDIRIIHLKRRNILKTHVSRERAARTDKWTNVDGSSEDEQMLTLDYDRLLQDFVQTRSWEEEYDRFFEDHPKIEVFYESLTKDNATELWRIQEFLGVECRDLTPETFRQSRRALAKSISNYYELKGRFKGSPWEGFFEE
jgi:LPS sulfotransferase NodH